MKKILWFFVIFLSFVQLLAADLDIPLKDLEFGGVSADKVSLNAGEKRVTLYLTVNGDLLAGFNDAKLELLSRHYLDVLVKFNIDFSHLSFMVRTKGEDVYKPVTELLPKLPPVPKKDDETVSPKKTKALVPQKRAGNIQGALSGKTVFVSAGHGWVYNTSTSGWGTQRGVSNGLIEDDSNAETVSYFLIPYLQNAGGAVFSARERDRQENMVIVDDEDGENFASSDGIFEESAGWSVTSDAGYGYGRMAYPIERGVNPLKSGKYRYASDGSSAWARWTANIPEDGFYHVYVAYRAGDNRSQDALYTVKHAGGSTEVRVDQQHHGSTWIDLGRFYFHAGISKESGSVTLTAGSADGKVIVADAVRFGGGRGLLKRGTVSGKPRWEEAAAPNIQFLGGTSGSVYNVSSNDRDDDVSARSRWAAWENEAGYDDSVYISMHSNAVDSTSVNGISTYIYSNQASGVGYVEGEAAEGSEELAALVHNRILQSVKTLFNSSYKEYGKGLYSAYFGEINPKNNNEMPSCLVEIAFHTSTTDAAMLKNPRYRDIVSRAAYQAIVLYFSQKDGTEAVFLPGNPEALRTKVNEDGTLTLSWSAPKTDADRFLGDAAAGYIVQTSSDGIAFSDGEDVGNVLEYTGTFEADKPVYFRVIAYNGGGVSFPSAAAGAVPRSGGAQILVVDGFERIDNSMPRFASTSNGEYRYLLEFINSFNYVNQYAPLLAELGYSVDSAQRANVKDMDLSSYDMVFWFLGEQSTADETFTHEEQEIVTEFVDGGGAFFVSGAEIGWDLDHKGDTADKAFFHGTLNAGYVSDEAGVYTFFGAGDYSLISGNFDNGTYIYQAEYADVLEPYDNSAGSFFLFYDNAMSLGAGIITNSDSKKVAVMGFPLETVLDRAAKIGLMEKILDEFGITPEENGGGDTDTGNTDTGDTDTGDSDTGNTDTGDTDTSDSDTGDSDTGDSDTGDSDTGNPDSGDTGTGNTDSGDTDTADTDTADTDTGDTDTVDPDTGDIDTDSSDSESQEISEEEKNKKGGCSAVII